MGQGLSTAVSTVLKPFGIEDEADLLKPPTPSTHQYSEKWVELYTSGAFPLSLGALTVAHGSYHLWLRPTGSRLFPGVMIACGIFHAALGALMESGESAGQALHSLLGERNTMNYDFRARGVSDPSLLGLEAKSVRSAADRSADIFQLGHVLSIASIFPAMAMNQLVFPGVDSLDAAQQQQNAAESYRSRRPGGAAGAGATTSAAAIGAAAQGPYASSGSFPTTRAAWATFLRNRETAQGARKLWTYITLLHMAYHAIGFQVVSAQGGGISVLQMRARLEKQREIEDVVRQAVKERQAEEGVRRLDEQVRAPGPPPRS